MTKRVARFINNRSSRLRPVVVDAWPAALCAGGIIIAYLSGDLATGHEDGYRFAGGTLELLGLLTIVIGFRDLRRLFGLPSLPSTIANWFTRLVAALLPPRPISLQGTAASGAVAAGTATVSRAPNPHATIEERLQVLERDVEAIRSELGRGFSEVWKDLASARKAWDTERRTLEEKDSELQKLLHTVSVGGIRLEIVGTIWLAVGIVANGFPQELAAWFPIF